MIELIVATKNEGKVREILHLLKDLPLEVKGLAEISEKIQLPEETGATFLENARLKARCVYQQISTLPLTPSPQGRGDIHVPLSPCGRGLGRGAEKENIFILADDSGLECVDLGGAPGITSARYAGLNATDDDNNKKLVEELQGIHDATRGARYVCALVLIDVRGQETIVVETCEGMITLSPSGTGGFGYDPYFYLPVRKCTMAELSLGEKNKISHRGKALMCLRQKLSSYK